MRYKTMLAIVVFILVSFIVACGGQTAEEASPAEEAVPAEGVEEGTEEPAAEAPAEEAPAEEAPAEEGAGEQPAEEPVESEEPVAEELAPKPALNCVAHPELNLPVRIPAGEITSTENHARIFWTIFAASYGRTSASERLINEYGVDSLEALVKDPLVDYGLVDAGTVLLPEDFVSLDVTDPDGAEITVEQFLADYYGLGSFNSLIQELTNELVWKEVSVWRVADGSAQEVLCDEFDLQVNLVCPILGDAAVDDAMRRELFWLQVDWLDDVLRTNEIILDNGCYLQIVDEGLSAQAADMDIMLEERLAASEAVVSEEEAREITSDVEAVLSTAADAGDDNIQFENGFYVGENISLELFYDATGNGLHPLFHHPQYYVPARDEADGAVSAFEAVGGEDIRSAIWQVGADEFNAPYFDVSEPYGLAGHLLARQDQVISADTGAYDAIVSNSKTTCERDRQPYFEFEVGADAQPAPRCDNSTHYFWTGEETFYIGFLPGTDALAMLDIANIGIPEGGGITLRGGIKDLVFDPNASCGYC